ncbi:MAG: hypothetical protein JWN14_1672 [Chthonomonadales bacterium]|nr:hypothetical protein [Chthonomonadales bacterium]
MQHQFSSSEEPTLSAYVALKGDPMVQARIDGYLDRSCAPLFRTLPQEEAAEQRAEMRSHMESMVAAYIELGSSEIEAVSLTLEQFGSEQSVERAWRQECDTVQAEAGRGTFWSAIRPTLGYVVANGIALPIMLEVYAAITHRYFETGAALPGSLTATALLVFCAEYALFPGFLGFLAGRRARGKTLVASVVALPILQLLCLSLTTWISYGPTFSHHMSEMLGGSTLAFCANSLGCSILGVGVAWRKQKRALRLAKSR